MAQVSRRYRFFFNPVKPVRLRAVKIDGLVLNLAREVRGPKTGVLSRAWIMLACGHEQ